MAWVAGTRTEAEATMADDAITLIIRDHRRMEDLFDRLQTEPENRPRLLEEIEAVLTAHNRAEEDEVYPVVVRTTGEVPQVRHSAEEHQEAEEILTRLKDCDPNSEEFEELRQEFVDEVKHHVEEEESEILPALKRAVGEKRVRELGKAFSERREQELRRFGFGDASGRIPRQRELYEEAKRLDIKDRSKMNKEELAEAVQRAKSR